MGSPYEQAGVPPLKGNPAFNRKISGLIRSTRISGVLGSPTGFAALFDIKKNGLEDPLLVSSTDGVGTKLEIARLQRRHDTIGIDLVAMCVNDIVTTGAKPVFFLDYFATGRFDSSVTAQVLKGIAAGCRMAGCALIGGETAVMPGFYQGADNKQRLAPQYDLAGFAVGVIERRKLIDGTRIKKGDKLLGLASSGFHSNGYALLRKVFSKKQLGGSLGRKLLVPTRIYVPYILNLLRSVPLSGIVNITGGGFMDNLPRVMPDGLGAVIKQGAWPCPNLFQLVKQSVKISNFEMMHTFNMGIGMVLVVKPSLIERTQRALNKMQLGSWVIGEIIQGKGVQIA